MLELNIFSAVLLGSLAAAVWTAVFIRRLLRSPACRDFTGLQKLAVWGVGALAFLPSLFVAFTISVALANITVQPGQWNHLTLSLTIVFGLGLVGTAINWIAVKVAAAVIQRKRTSPKSGAN